jgi:hypothetical protein
MNVVFLSFSVSLGPMHVLSHARTSGTTRSISSPTMSVTETNTICAKEYGGCEQSIIRWESMWNSVKWPKHAPV